MFGTSKKIKIDSTMIDELARLYLNQHHEESETPEDYLVRFIQTRYRMEQRFNEELQNYIEKNPISPPPPMPPKKDSTWNYSRF